MATSRVALNAAWQSSSATDRRRRQYAERQHNERQQRLERARILIADQTTTNTSISSDDNEQDHLSTMSDVDQEKRGRQKARARRLRFACQLSAPDFMLNVPSDLRENWFVLARPEGYRVLVIAQGATCVSRRIDGGLLHQFQSALPNGSKYTQERDESCILDCVFSQADRTYYVIDMLRWKNYELVNSSTEFRFFWVSTKLAETRTDIISDANEYRFLPIQCGLCTPENLQAAYSNAFGYTKDGLLFYHRQALYSNDVCPLVLVWKDQLCSSYFVEARNGAPHTITLIVRGDQVHTREGIMLGNLPHDVAGVFRHDANRVLRFAIDGVELNADMPQLIGIRFLGACSSSKLFAHHLSKIVFQSLARHNRTLPFSVLLDHTTSSTQTSSTSNS